MNSLERPNVFAGWIKCILCIFIAACVVMGTVNIVADPFFHYHRPIMKYRLNNERYVNDGIARHFEYDALITGNSLTENFRVSEYDSLFDADCIKLPYAGADTTELWLALGRTLGRNDVKRDKGDDAVPYKYRKQYKAREGYSDNVKSVLACLYCEDILNEDFWSGYAGAPEYLYDDNLFNDVEYIFNKDTLYRGTIYNTLLTLRGGDSTSFDEYSVWERTCGYTEACSELRTIENGDGNARVITDSDKKLIDDCLDYNVIPVVEANPDTQFLLFLPPLSVAKWAEYYSVGEVGFRIDCMDHILNRLVGYDNVTIYGFDDEFALTADLTRYCDAIHYDSGVNSWMLEQMAAGAHIVTESSVEDYIRSLRDRYEGYDFTELNQYIR